MVTALNDGTPMWGTTDHLLADLWALTVQVNTSDKAKRDGIDHPVRAEVTAKAKAMAKKSLKSAFLQRKTNYARGGE